MARTKWFKYDWPALEAEWLQCPEETLDSFRVRKGVPNATHFYKRARQFKWAEKKAEIIARARKKIMTRTANAVAERWGDYTKLWSAVKFQAAAILKSTRDAEGNIIPLDPQKLSQLSNAIETALKSEKLIAGESTGDGMSFNGDINVLVTEHIQSKKNEPGVFDVKPEEILNEPDPSPIEN